MICFAWAQLHSFSFLFSLLCCLRAKIKLNFGTKSRPYTYIFYLNGARERFGFFYSPFAFSKLERDRILCNVIQTWRERERKCICFCSLPLPMKEGKQHTHTQLLCGGRSLPYLPLNFYTTLSRNDNIIGFSAATIWHFSIPFPLQSLYLFSLFSHNPFSVLFLRFIAGAELQSHHSIVWKNLAVRAVNLISVLWLFMTFILLVTKKEIKPIQPNQPPRTNK